jgi:hypothetical protein
MASRKGVGFAVEVYGNFHTDMSHCRLVDITMDQSYIAFIL